MVNCHFTNAWKNWSSLYTIQFVNHGSIWRKIKKTIQVRFKGPMCAISKFKNRSPQTSGWRHGCNIYLLYTVCGKPAGDFNYSVLIRPLRTVWEHTDHIKVGLYTFINPWRLVTAFNLSKGLKRLNENTCVGVQGIHMWTESHTVSWMSECVVLFHLFLLSPCNNWLNAEDLMSSWGISLATSMKSDSLSGWIDSKCQFCVSAAQNQTELQSLQEECIPEEAKRSSWKQTRFSSFVLERHIAAVIGISLHAFMCNRQLITSNDFPSVL